VAANQDTGTSANTVEMAQMMIADGSTQRGEFGPETYVVLVDFQDCPEVLDNGIKSPVRQRRIANFTSILV
jgi:hypothetical protein